jgi:hypothetical protein
MQGGSTDPASLVISPESVDRLNKPLDEPASSECRLSPSPLKQKTTKSPLRGDKNYFEERYLATLLPGKSEVHLPSIPKSCVTCSTKMLLHDQGINDISDREVAQELDHDDAKGAKSHKIPRVLRRSAVPYRWVENLTIEDLREALKSGYSIAAIIKQPQGELNDHSVVVDKIGKKNVYIRDCRHEEPYKVSIDAWKKAWNGRKAVVPMLYCPRVVKDEMKGKISKYKGEINRYKEDEKDVIKKIEKFNKKIGDLVKRIDLLSKNPTGDNISEIKKEIFEQKRKFLNFTNERGLSHDEAYKKAYICEICVSKKDLAEECLKIKKKIQNIEDELGPLAEKK